MANRRQKGSAAAAMAVALVGSFEGLRQNAYPDPATQGKQWTIRYGATNAGILAAQATVVNNSTVFAGENVELIGPSGRYDNTHLNEAGAEQRAPLAVAALTAAVGLN